MKKEIRVLGLDTCNSTTMLGAIVRGGLYLDGIMALGCSNDSVRAAEDVVKSKYFPELKVIMVHDPRRSLNIGTLRRITKLPIIKTHVHGIPHPRTKPRGRQKQFVESISLGLNVPTMKRVLLLTSLMSRTPEPVRIAHLLAKVQIFGKLSQDKG